MPKELTFYEPIINPKGVPKGSIEGTLSKEGPVKVKFTIMEAQERGKGYGAKAYERLATKALRVGKTLESDSSVSHAGGRMYESLARKGFEVQTNSKVRSMDAGEPTGNIKYVKQEPVYTVKSGPVEPSSVFTAEEATASVGRARAAGTLKGMANVGGKALCVTGAIL